MQTDLAKRYALDSAADAGRYVSRMILLYKQIFSILGLLLILFASVASANETVVDLNGFRLQQIFHVAKNVYGDPFTTVGNETKVGKAFRVGEEAYMIFSYHAKYENSIAAMQLTGVLPNTPVFLGLSLGDPKEKVLKALGPPDDIKEISEPLVKELKYNDRNYSVELDSSGRLYSIRIFTTKKIVSDIDSETDTWTEFSTAIKSMKFSEVEKMLRPDVEIYKDGQTFSVKGRYSDFQNAPDQNIVDSLFSESESVLSEVKTFTPEKELRLILDFGVGEVYKFKTSKVLREIVFFPFNGKYRVYEIAFR